MVPGEVPWGVAGALDNDQPRENYNIHGFENAVNPGWCSVDHRSKKPDQTMTKPVVYVLDPYHIAAINELRKHSNVDHVLPEDVNSSSSWHNTATALLVRSESQIMEAEIQKTGPNLKYIIKQGVGVDNIDLESCRKKGIQVFNTPALNSESVAELTLTLALCIARRINEIDRGVRDGQKIIRSKTLGKSLFQKTLGVVGMGNIGIRIAKKWMGAMNGSVVAFDPYAARDAWSAELNRESWRRVDTLQDLLKVSDVVTLHVPLTKTTENLLSGKEFDLMKEGAILLNCARGGVVDEAALLAALESGRLFGAGLDAMLREPPTREEYGETLLSHPRVLLTPHIGASTEENQAKSGLAAVEILLRLLGEVDAAGPMPQPLN